MDHGLTEEQKMLQAAAKEFARGKIAPIAKELDEKAEFPYEAIKEMGENNFFGLIFPQEYGGVGLGYLCLVIATEEICKASVMLGSQIWGVQFPGEMIYRFGNEYLKQKYLTSLAQGKVIPAISFSEPDTGTFPQGIKTTAVLKDNQYLLNGLKRFHSLSSICDFSLIIARTAEKGLSVFLVERGKSDGWSNTRPENLMGRRGLITGDCILENVTVPSENLVGEINNGYHMLLAAVARVESPGIAAESIGIAQAALDEAIKFSQTRIQPWLGKPISTHQGIQYRIADMSTEIEAARSLTYNVGRLLDQGVIPRKEAAMAKLFSSEMANRVVNSAMIVHSGYGYIKDSPIERLYRDQKLSQLYGGTVDIQRIIIAHNILDL